MKISPGGKPSSAICGSNVSAPWASRRSDTRMLARGILARTVKFSFRSIAALHDAYHEIAARIESLHGNLKLRGRGHNLERIHGGRAQTRSLGMHVDSFSGHQIEVERAVLPEGIAGPQSIGDFAAQRTSDQRRVGRLDAEAAGDLRDRDAVTRRMVAASRGVGALPALSGADRNARRERLLNRFIGHLDREEVREKIALPAFRRTGEQE